MGRHVLPNVISQAIIYSMSDIVQDMLAIVTLGYFGLGVPPPTADLGSMINDGQNFITTHWQLTTFPGLVVVLVGLGLSLDRRRARRPDQAGTDMTVSGGTGPGTVGSPATGPGTPVLEVRDLHVGITSRSGLVHAVDGVSFDVGRGEALAWWGSPDPARA